MTEAKTIKLLLSNGSLSGLLIAELLKWDGILFSSPRETYLELIGIKVFKTKKKVTKKSQRINALIEEEINYSEKIDITETVNDADKLNKTKAISLLKEKGFDFTNKVISYATLQEKKRVYWLNPKNDAIEKEWIILLNNQFNRKIIVLDIPPYSFSVVGDLTNNLIIRKDKPRYIDLNLSEKDLIDVRTRLEFRTYIKEEVKY